MGEMNFEMKNFSSSQEQNFSREKNSAAGKNSLQGWKKYFKNLIPQVFLKPLSIVMAITFLLGIGSGFFQSAKTDEVEPFNVTVAGNFGAPVSLQVQGDVTTASSSVTTLIKGSLPKIEEGGQLLYRAESFLLEKTTMKLTAGEVVNYTGSANQAELGELASVIIGHEMGSRILLTSTQTGSDTAIELVVVDILPNTVIGEALTVSGEYTFPEIMVADNGRPVLSGKAAAVTEPQTATVIQGEGLQVEENAKIVVNYVLTDLNAQVLENTWDQAAPKVIDLAEVYLGLKNALLDQKVGSRVITVIPAAQAQGEKDVMLVVDILSLVEETSESAE